MTVSAPHPDRMDLDELKRLLVDRVQEVARHYAPAGRAVRGNWIACCPYRADHNPGSFRIGLGGRHRGVVVDFAEDQRGFNLFEFVRRCIGAAESAEGVRETIAEARRFLGLELQDEAALARARARSAAIAAQVAAERDQAARDLDRNRKEAKSMWLAGHPLAAGDPVWSYLAGRGIALDQLPGEKPGALRAHSSLWEAESRRPYPTMLAAVSDPSTGQFLAVHRTYLSSVNGLWVKAAIGAAKKTWPSFAGGVIAVWRGSRTTSIRHHDSAKHGPLWLTEGIEDALSIALARPDRSVAATVSVGNLANIALPPAARDLVLAQDNDGENPAVAAAIDAALARWAEEGRTVRTWRAPVGKDANDVLRGVEAAA
jgi:hypothetical protein